MNSFWPLKQLLRVLLRDLPCPHWSRISRISSPMIIITVIMGMIMGILIIIHRHHQFLEIVLLMILCHVQIVEAWKLSSILGEAKKRGSAMQWRWTCNVTHPLMSRVDSTNITISKQISKHKQETPLPPLPPSPPQQQQQQQRQQRQRQW